MRTPLIALALGLTALTALPAAATDLSGQTRPGPTRPGAEPQQHPGEGGRGPDRNEAGNDRYGRWDSNWGSRPPAPPRHFTRTADWNRHVRACQQRFRSYDARTDRYVPRRGQTAVCRL